MGTNYYLKTRNKKIAKEIGRYELMDEPDFHYEIHLGKRSGGWLPLLQAAPGIKSVKDIERYCTMPDVQIFNEYSEELTWEQLKEELIYWNGGYDGAIPKEKVERDPTWRFYDPDMPDHVPVSHFEYGNGKYASYYFKDEGGWEFDKTDFS
jgi:hypothetical protein